MQSKEGWVKKLSLTPHPEGGYFKETFRSKNLITLPGKFDKPHSTGTEIYYLLGSETIGNFSAWHKFKNLEETWHFHCGSDLTLYLIDQDGALVEKTLGDEKNAELQVHVPSNTWFCAVCNGRNKTDYTLVSCSVFPGFEFEDFELANQTALSTQFPQHRKIIERFTRA